jgi:hypothetical protein
MRTAHLTLTLIALATLPLHAEKLSREFKASFEQTFRPGWTHAVVVQPGIPTTSIYGINGDQKDAHYSVDCRDGGWKTSQGLLDSDQVAADALALGEVMELASISYKDNRVDLRLVSLAAHKVTRGTWPSQETKREPVATNFKFFFPFPETQTLGPEQMPQVIAFVQRYLQPFPDEAGARAFAARLELSGEAPAVSAAVLPAAADPAGQAPRKEIAKGMTALEVIEILGRPEKEVSFEDKSRWTYPDLTVIFENGRVAEVRF